jgi:small subunit ribosomal protein S20
MAHTKSAIKKIRKYAEQRARNTAAKSFIKTNRRKMDAALEAKDQDATKQTYASLCSALDKAVKRGNLKKGTAVRRKARAAARMRNAAAATA